jgi:hypothetical protein
MRVTKEKHTELLLVSFAISAKSFRAFSKFEFSLFRVYQLKASSEDEVNGKRHKNNIKITDWKFIAFV